MSYLRVLYLTITAGISGYLYQNHIYKINPNKQGCKNYLNNYLQPLNLTTSAKINGYFYKYIPYKWHNYFNVRAQVETMEQGGDYGNFHRHNFDDEEEDEEDDDDEEEEENDEEDENNLVFDEFLDQRAMRILDMKELDKCGRDDHLLNHAGFSYPHEEIASRLVVKHKDILVYTDSMTRTPWWTTKVITKDNVEEAEHDHLEALELDTDMPDGFEYGQGPCNLRMKVDVLRRAKVRPKRHPEQKPICYQCCRLRFWKVFQQYLKFLTIVYDNVVVCSGVLLIGERRLMVSHYFKILACQNPDKSWRFECYKVENEHMRDRYPNLRDYLVSREQLKQDAGFDAFSFISDSKIVNRNTHPGFNQDQWLAAYTDYVPEVEGVGDKYNKSGVPVLIADSFAELFAGDNKLASVARHPDIPTRCIIRYRNYTIHCDSLKRTRWWTQQVITKHNVVASEHAHCERMKLVVKERRLDQPLEITSVMPPTTPHQNKQKELVCAHCDFTNVWTVFHQYIKFLIGKYPSVVVISGLVFSPHDDGVEDKSQRQATHFFKALKCKNDDGTYRLECYVIPFTAAHEDWFDLSSFIVSRKELKTRTRIAVFEDIDDSMLKNCQTHELFPKRTPILCHMEG